MRGWGRGGISRWTPALLFLAGLYLFLLLLSQKYIREQPMSIRELAGRQKIVNEDYKEEERGVPKVEKTNDNEGVLNGQLKEMEQPKKFVFTFKSSQYPPFEVENVLTNSFVSFNDRMNAEVRPNEGRKMILSWDAGHSAENLKGCPDWNCDFITDKNQADKADVILLTNGLSFVRRNKKQIVVYFSQESPKNMQASVPTTDYFNISLGYRHDTLAASPYGYTVKLAKERPLGTVINNTRIWGKTKTAAWFVSHCSTNSLRENFVAELKKYITVDIYGGCMNGSHCPRGGECEKMLDTDYHFYMALENSICTDYITEKVWSQGYERDVLPVVLKRSIVENRLPPRSFLAVDDYSTVKEMADHMKALMDNKTAYLEYFSWRRHYQTVFLNGREHNALERPWGFCQLCRLAWLSNPPSMLIHDFRQWWDGSCEKDGETVNRILNGSRHEKKDDKKLEVQKDKEHLRQARTV